MTGPVPSDPSSRGRVAVWVVVPVAVVLALLLLLLATREPSSQRAVDSDLIGQLAPEVAGPTIAGPDFAIDDHRGRWIVVNFFSTTCIPCIQEHPELVTFQQRHEAAGDATVVSIAFDDSADNVARFFVDNGGEWPVLVEDTGGIAVRYGVTGVPESYLVAPTGVVAAKYVGGVEADQLDETIDRLAGTA